MIVDNDYGPQELASSWLRSRYFAGAHAEPISAEYASSIALCLTWTGGGDLPQPPGDRTYSSPT